MNFKTGLQLYSVRDEMAKDMEKTLAAVADMGYEYVEFAGYYGRSSEQLSELLRKYSLKCISVHQSIDFYDSDPESAIAFLKGFGVRYSVIPWYDGNKLADDDAWKATAADFARVSALLEAHDMKLMYHNHDFEFKKKNGAYIHDRIISDVPGILPQLDTCWVHYAGIDPVVMLEKYSGRVPVVHLKDFVCRNLAACPVYALIDSEGNAKGGSLEDTGFDYRPLGQGIQDIPAILRACERAGTEYIIVEQDESSDMPTLDAARISREYLRSLGV